MNFSLIDVCQRVFSSLFLFSFLHGSTNTGAKSVFLYFITQTLSSLSLSSVRCWRLVVTQPQSRLCPSCAFSLWIGTVKQLWFLSRTTVMMRQWNTMFVSGDNKYSYIILSSREQKHLLPAGGCFWCQSCGNTLPTLQPSSRQQTTRCSSAR